MKFKYRDRVAWWARVAAAVPVDLVAVVLATLLADAVVLAVGPSPLRLVAGLVLLCFLPGYAVVASLYPRAGTNVGGTGISTGERLALSFGASVAMAPLFGLVLWQTGLWVSPLSLTVAVSLVVVVAAVVATVRRLLVPPPRRFTLSLDRWAGAVRDALFRSTPGSERALNVVLAVSVLVAASSLGYALVSPQGGEEYTNVALLTENDAGELVASGYPSFAAGESGELVLQVENHENARTTYTVVVRVEEVGPDGATVTGAEELRRFDVAVRDGRTRTVRHEVAPTTTGDRLAYYVYRGDAPADPGASSAYRHLYVWVSAGES